MSLIYSLIQLCFLFMNFFISLSKVSIHNLSVHLGKDQISLSNEFIISVRNYFQTKNYKQIDNSQIRDDLIKYFEKSDIKDMAIKHYSNILYEALTSDKKMTNEQLKDINLDQEAFNDIETVINYYRSDNDRQYDINKIANYIQNTQFYEKTTIDYFIDNIMNVNRHQFDEIIESNSQSSKSTEANTELLLSDSQNELSKYFKDNHANFFINSKTIFENKKVIIPIGAAILVTLITTIILLVGLPQSTYVDSDSSYDLNNYNHSNILPDYNISNEIYYDQLNTNNKYSGLISNIFITCSIMMIIVFTFLYLFINYQ